MFPAEDAQYFLNKHLFRVLSSGHCSVCGPMPFSLCVIQTLLRRQNSLASFPWHSLLCYFIATFNVYSFGPYDNEDGLLISEIGNWVRQRVKGNVYLKLRVLDSKPILNSHIQNILYVYSTTTSIANVSAYCSRKTDLQESSWMSNLRSPAKFLVT